LTRESDDLVDHYLLDWDSREWASAYHTLIELGPQVLPELSRRFGASHDVAFRAVLVDLARHVHSSDALPLFDSALQDESPEVWKEALDGLVDLASPDSILLLEEAMARTPPGRTSVAEWRSWIREALQQARAEYEARGGAA
jgi:HEAT repeat protein